MLDGLEVSDGARPGVAVRLASESGVTDLTVVSVHLESTPRAWPRRKRQLEALAAAVTALVGRFGDEDVVVAGDFNTSGWEGGSPQRELQRADGILRRAGLRRVQNESGCTAYWEGRRGGDGLFERTLTDHVYVRGEAFAGVATATSWLHCARLECSEQLISKPGAEDGTFFDVSDHCPVVVDVPKDVTDPTVRRPYRYPDAIRMRSYNPVTRGHSGQIRKAVELLFSARRPVITTRLPAFMNSLVIHLPPLTRPLKMSP